MGSVSNLVKGVVQTASGGLLGGPKIEKPEPVKAPAAAAIDPNTGKALADAKRRASALAKAKGRKSFRIDLATGNQDEPLDTRSGLSIK